MIGETPTFVEPYKFWLADKLHAADILEKRVSDDRIHQHGPQPCFPLLRRDDYVKNHGEVDTIRDHSSEAHQSVGYSVNQREDQV